MKQPELLRILRQVRCRVLTPEAAGNDPHRLVLALLAQGMDDPDVTILCEPSLAQSSLRPPDVVAIDPASGVHVVEVKAVHLEQVAGIDPGGTLQIRYGSGTRRVTPIQQVRNAMFDVKNATERAFGAELTTPFHYWVAFPSITRSAWEDRWGEGRLCLPEFLFQDDLDLPALIDRMRAAGRKFLARHEITRCPPAQIRAVLEAFGDAPEPPRPARPTKHEGSLGEQFDLAAASYRRLSDEQQRLAEQLWEEGPRLVRGVAGSGKTVVLAHNCARRLARMAEAADGLFGGRPPRVLAVCFNRTLAPLIRDRILAAHRTRTGGEPPEGSLDVFAFNQLMWHLARERGLWRYQKLEEVPDQAERARRYIAELEAAPDAIRERCLYDAVYVDEGQDMEQAEFDLLRRLCRTDGGREPSLFVFFDDAQNLYARPRPNWGEVGLNIVGRSSVMSRCFRNTRQIVEPAFNMLVGSYAERTVQNRQYADIAGLRQRGLVDELEGGHVRVSFACREGAAIEPYRTDTPEAEADWIAIRLRKLLVDEEVRPEDILVLTLRRERAQQIANRLEQAAAAGELPVRGIRVPFLDEAKDEPISLPGHLTVSTIHSAKGYDAYVVLVAGVEAFADSEEDRAAFYVACTRARELLEVTGVGRSPLARELAMASRLVAAASAANDG